MKDLRELAKEYAQGVIDKETYRKSRKELIQGICNGDIKVEPREYLAPLEIIHESLDDTTENMITQIVNPKNKPPTPPSRNNKQERATASPTPSSSASRKQKNFFYISTACVIVVCAIVLAILLFPSEESHENTDATVSPTSSEGQKLIIELIQNKNWSQENLNTFSDSWQNLSFDQREIAISSLEMKRLNSTIYQKLLDERALLSLGDVDNAVANQQKLVNFASQIGIFDERFVVVESKKEHLTTDKFGDNATTPTQKKN